MCISCRNYSVIKSVKPFKAYILGHGINWDFLKNLSAGHPRFRGDDQLGHLCINLNL